MGVFTLWCWKFNSTQLVSRNSKLILHLTWAKIIIRLEDSQKDHVVFATDMFKMISDQSVSKRECSLSMVVNFTSVRSCCWWLCVDMYETSGNPEFTSVCGLSELYLCLVNEVYCDVTYIFAVLSHFYWEMMSPQTESYLYANTYVVISIKWAEWQIWISHQKGSTSCSLVSLV